MRIRRLPRAIRDVDDLWLHIAADDPAAATHMVERLAAGVARLWKPANGTTTATNSKDERVPPYNGQATTWTLTQVG